jgi:hypothetical protein
VGKIEGGKDRGALRLRSGLAVLKRKAEAGSEKKSECGNEKKLEVR